MRVYRRSVDQPVKRYHRADGRKKGGQTVENHISRHGQQTVVVDVMRGPLEDIRRTNPRNLARRPRMPSSPMFCGAGNSLLLRAPGRSEERTRRVGIRACRRQRGTLLIHCFTSECCAPRPRVAESRRLLPSRAAVICASSYNIRQTCLFRFCQRTAPSTSLPRKN